MGLSLQGLPERTQLWLQTPQDSFTSFWGACTPPLLPTTARMDDDLGQEKAWLFPIHLFCSLHLLLTLFREKQ